MDELLQIAESRAIRQLTTEEKETYGVLDLLTQSILTIIILLKFGLKKILKDLNKIDNYLTKY
jgi:hypothetical protein